MKEKLELLKLLADETRLKILNILMREDSYVEKIACDLSLTPATICYHLKKMESAGIVSSSRSQFYIIYSLNRDIFDKPLYELIKADTQVITPEEKYKKEVLSNFFKYGRLKTIPMQRKKREIVLLEIAKSFEYGVKYSEKEVNGIIHRFHEDHCTIRREMIASGIMSREKEIYWLNKDEKDNDSREDKSLPLGK
ncbi:MAG: metalloregulator ArsR/SmtB family transcription factor [Clostridia bacterium]|nr:metalloregulator ArsR/SmtB family transcription factor [Clostridia bacterium]